ncbi:MAG: hypothetical protein GY869_25200 [Planctomycetes bacterium]|nr:hypothetical protein [Planctomycetota bacterium]
MLILRIKQAEVALNDGRLDEAFELAGDRQVRQHRHGQKLVDRLLKALVERGRGHLEASRLQQGMADCSKAEKLGGNTPNVAELRAALVLAVAEKNQQDRQQSDNLAQAKQHVAQGWPSAAEQVLAGAEKDSNEAEIVMQQAAARRIEIDYLANKAQELVNQGDLESAIELLAQAPLAQKQNKKMTELFGSIRSTALHRTREYINGGRIDLAQSMLDRVSLLKPETMEMQELGQVLAKCRRARQLLESGQPRQAVSVLQQIKSILPSVKWLDKSINQANQAAEALDSLRVGPLGLVMSSEYWQQDGSNSEDKLNLPIAAKRDGPQAESPVPEIKPLPGQPMPARFVVQIDGVGSYMVLREATVTLGPISSSRRPSVGLVADPNLPVASIERAEGDYFIRTEQPIEINDKPVTEKLLMNGDKVSFSPRCRMKFHVPNAASTTAALSFMGARLPRADMKQAILLDRELIIGPGGSAHIRAARATESAALFVRDGRLFCRSNESLTVDGKAATENTPLPMETAIKVGEISLVITKD